MAAAQDSQTVVLRTPSAPAAKWFEVGHGLGESLLPEDFDGVRADARLKQALCQYDSHLRQAADCPAPQQSDVERWRLFRICIVALAQGLRERADSGRGDTSELLSRLSDLQTNSELNAVVFDKLIDVARSLVQRSIDLQQFPVSRKLATNPKPNWVTLDKLAEDVLPQLLRNRSLGVVGLSDVDISAAHGRFWAPAMDPAGSFVGAVHTNTQGGGMDKALVDAAAKDKALAYYGFKNTLLTFDDVKTADAVRVSLGLRPESDAINPPENDVSSRCYGGQARCTSSSKPFARCKRVQSVMDGTPEETRWRLVFLKGSTAYRVDPQIFAQEAQAALLSGEKPSPALITSPPSAGLSPHEKDNVFAAPAAVLALLHLLQSVLQLVAAAKSESVRQEALTQVSESWDQSGALLQPFLSAMADDDRTKRTVLKVCGMVSLIHPGAEPGFYQQIAAQAADVLGTERDQLEQSLQRARQD